MITQKLKSKCIGLAGFLFFSIGLNAQQNDDRLGLPGDNLNLAAVLDIFQQSKTLEDFEQSLNSESNKINNLDLNNDQQIDYIKVMDHVEGTMHSIVLQTELNKGDMQDIAVIYVDKDNNGTKIQVIGDEDLYGKNYVVEPATKSTVRGTANPGYSGNDQTVNNYTTNNYYRTEQSYAPDPSTWYIISYMYGPHYSLWSSPWYWGYYPVWWRPWAPVFWSDYHHHCYYNHHWNGWWYYRAHHFHFHNHWHNTYYGYHKTSPTVLHNREKGVYKNTYSKADAAPQVPAGKPNFPSINKHDREDKPLEGRPIKSNDNVEPRPRVHPRENDNKDRAEPAKPVRSEPAPRPKTKVKHDRDVKPEVKPAPKPAPKPEPKKRDAETPKRERK